MKGKKIWIIGLSTLAVCGIGYFIYRQNKKKNALNGIAAASATPSNTLSTMPDMGLGTAPSAAPANKKKV